MAEHASIPVINALSDLEHPCQALADYFTLQERFGDLRKIQLAYVGDGNNVAHSLLLTCACIGSKIRVATPPGYGPDAKVVADAQEMAHKTGAVIEMLTDPNAGGRRRRCGLHRCVGQHGPGARSGGAGGDFPALTR